MSMAISEVVLNIFHVSLLRVEGRFCRESSLPVYYAAVSKGIPTIQASSVKW